MPPKKQKKRAQRAFPPAHDDIDTALQRPIPNDSRERAAINDQNIDATEELAYRIYAWERWITTSARVGAKREYYYSKDGNAKKLPKKWADEDDEEKTRWRELVPREQEEEDVEEEDEVALSSGDSAEGDIGTSDDEEWSWNAEGEIDPAEEAWLQGKIREKLGERGLWSFEKEFLADKGDANTIGGRRSFQLWRCDENEKNIDWMVVKKSYRESAPLKTAESRLHRRLSKLGCSHILRNRGYAQRKKRKIHYDFLDFAPFGDLRSLMDSHTKRGRPIPEPYLWVIFFALAEAMQTISTGRCHEKRKAWMPGPSGPPTKKRIVHLAVSDRSVLLGPKCKHRFPMYPTPVLGNFGLALDIQGQKSEVRGTEFEKERGRGVEGWKAPENCVEAPYKQSIPRDADTDPAVWDLTSATDIFGIGLVMWCSMHCIVENSRGKAPNGFNYADPGSLPIPEPNEYTGLYSEGLIKLVDRCLQWKPSERIKIDGLVREIGRGLNDAVAFFGDFLREDISPGFEVEYQPHPFGRSSDDGDGQD